MYLTGSVRFTSGQPRDPCGFHKGMGTSVPSRANAVRAWGYIYQAKHEYVTFDPLGSERLLTDLL